MILSMSFLKNSSRLFDFSLTTSFVEIFWQVAHLDFSNVQLLSLSFWAHVEENIERLRQRDVCRLNRKSSSTCLKNFPAWNLDVKTSPFLWPVEGKFKWGHLSTEKRGNFKNSESKLSWLINKNLKSNEKM